MNILLVDYDTDSRAEVAGFLREMGHHVTEQSDEEEAYADYTTGAFSIVLFINYNDRGTTVEILQKGAYDYFLKPISVIQLAAITDRIVEHHLLLHENKVLTEYLGEEVGHV